ncbi:MAG: Glutamyl-tRNA(Gln) amidotransferase subunit A [Firmicutes bacterium]|nr:Glutamyl-tRNA(Gln) amidotransferase subunit A [candidate division NPL-UPA2 bacterium]
MGKDSWLDNASLRDLQEAMHKGELSSEQLTAHCLRRIADHNKSGAGINAVLEINPDALHTALAMDTIRRMTGSFGPLHGIPVLLKDNINTADKMHTSAGSLALANHMACKDSFVATKLRRAGAVILGKANMTEWANFMAADMPNGYSSRGGQVKNPYGDFNVGGSSSGSAAGVAAGFAPLAVGTETSGSILSPAHSCSVVGIKPTVGLISRSGIIPIAHSQDTPGPIARTVADAALMLGAMVGVDDTDPVTMAQKGREVEDYLAGLSLDALRGARLGLVREYFASLDAPRAAVYDSAIAALTRLGAVIVEVDEYAAQAKQGDYKVLLYEFKPNINAYLGTTGPLVPVHSLADVIEFNSRDPAVRLKYGQTVLAESQETSGTLTEAEYITALQENRLYCREQGVDLALTRDRLDALVFPGNAGCSIAAKAGYPSVTVPAGYTALGRPVGLTFTGTAYSEHKLIKLAYAFEQNTKARIAPSLWPQK